MWAENIYKNPAEFDSRQSTALKVIYNNISKMYSINIFTEFALWLHDKLKEDEIALKEIGINEDFVI